MSWWEYKPRVTVIDVLEACACYAGVAAWCRAHGMQIAVQTADHLDEPYIVYAAYANSNEYDRRGGPYGNWYSDGNGYSTIYGDIGGNGYGDASLRNGYGSESLSNGRGDGCRTDGGYGFCGTGFGEYGWYNPNSGNGSGACCWSDT